MEDLTTWRLQPDSETFPFDAVVAAFKRVGKHFVPRDLLAELDAVRAGLPAPAGADDQVLAGFLATALDKWDDRYDNPSYLAVDLLGLPEGDDVPAAAHRRDRLFAMLVADLLRFELAAADGTTDLLPQLRPDARLTAKRCRLAVRAALPALARLGIAVDATEAGGLDAAREVCGAILADLGADERRLLSITDLTVSEVHDEHMFMRVLQAYETTFALIAVALRDAIGALADGRPRDAASALAAAEQAMREAKPLFSLVATMQPEAFLTFREFTDGASAIQSRSYKTVESLCRTPARARIDSPAYRSVPEVRERVLAGQPTFDDALSFAQAAGTLTQDELDAVRAAMARFEEAVLAWRQTHYRMAVRMLGERRGTGHTEGVPYLGAVRSIPLFAQAA
jgi:tryptophan 2,3-dioxygenase